ncbi:hypothetical protein B0O99DRAFT_688084 [Bisporella sp. PMI_857]|nr:hypothetical protein B0O99DRAFT_688084 [Bisporella sp. PMI_857]
MSNRERGDRDRAGERSGRSGQQERQFTREFFIPGEGIDRQVITADICRYLGNDARVKPYTYTDPRTGVRTDGYTVTAYRNLTTAMITDLKADSARWAAERSQNRAQPQNVGYTQSSTHAWRQTSGPSDDEPMSGINYQQSDPVYQTGPIYAASSSVVSNQNPRDVYEPESQYQSNLYGGQTASGFGSSQAPVYQPQVTPYYHGAQMVTTVDSRSAQPRTLPAPTVSSVPYAQSSTPIYGQQQQESTYYSPQVPSTSTSNQYGQQQSDAYYPRAAPTSDPYESPQPEYNNRQYQEVVYTQAPVTQTTATAGPSRRERERDEGHRDRDRDRDRDSKHHRRR